MDVMKQYENLKEKDINVCENFKPKTQIEVDAKTALMIAFLSPKKETLNPDKSTLNRIKGQIDAYVYIADGIKLHKEQNDIMARKLMLSSVLYITLIQIIFVIDKFLH